MTQDIIPPKFDPNACKVCGSPAGATDHLCPHGQKCDGTNKGGQFRAVMLVGDRKIESGCRACITSIGDRICGPYRIEEDLP